MTLDLLFIALGKLKHLGQKRNSAQSNFRQRYGCNGYHKLSTHTQFEHPELERLFSLRCLHEEVINMQEGLGVQLLCAKTSPETSPHTQEIPLLRYKVPADGGWLDIRLALSLQLP